VVAFVDDHVRVADCPAVIDVGLADSETVGAGVAGGGTAVTVSVADCEVVPPAPVHDSV